MRKSSSYAGRKKEIKMGHCIQVFIGKNNIIEKMASDWLVTDTVFLKQQFAMIYLTEKLFDNMEELADLENKLDYDMFIIFTSAIQKIMQYYSGNGMLAYLETDYFGGIGTQAGVLFEKGNMTVEPVEGEGTINYILERMGVYRERGKDEFDSLGLGNYRKMPLE